MIDLRLGDCLDVLKTFPNSSVDAVVTDPPYGLAFMGKKWDYDVPSVEVWAECLRVLKPGGHLLAFAGTRTQHRMACRIEDAGFEIRDMIMWVYGSGFPKSLDVSKAIDKAAGAEREVLQEATLPPVNFKSGTFNNRGPNSFGNGALTTPATPAAQQWQGWGTALKPAVEPITLARKPFPGTVATNVLQHCTGALNIDASRVGSSGGGTQCNNRDENGKCLGHKNAGRSTSGETFHGPNSLSSRWPANLIHDGSDEATQGMGDAARYFYTPKASKLDRDTGCHGLEEKARQTMGNGIGGQPNQDLANNRNHHPTVKPTDLMVYLCRLVTPPGGTVLDPFMGSGSTGRACQILDLSFIGIERDPGYFEIATHRINAPAQQELFA